MFLPGESQGQRTLVGCCLWGCTESDTTEMTKQQQQQQLTQISWFLSLKVKVVCWNYQHLIHLRHTQHRESTILAPDMAFQFPKQRDSGMSFEALAYQSTLLSNTSCRQKIFKLDYFFSLLYLKHKIFPLNSITVLPIKLRWQLPLTVASFWN